MLSGLLALNTVNKKDCEGWWLSGCCGSVAVQLRHSVPPVQYI